MTLIKLSHKDTPPRPVFINPEHVASMLPLRALLPSMNTQTPGAVEPRYTGTKIIMVDGTQYNVNELHEEVEKLMAPEAPVGDVVGLQEKLAHAADLGKGLVQPDQISSLDPFTTESPTTTNEPRHSIAEPATEADEQALQEAYGMSSDELADEAEAGYDISSALNKEELGELKVAHEEATANPVESSDTEQAKPAKKAPAKKTPSKKATDQPTQGDDE